MGVNGKELADPEKIKKALREYGEQAPEWPFRDEKVDVNKTAAVLKNELIDPILLLNRQQMPDPIIGFDNAGNQNVLAYYRKIPNAHGLPNEIIMNTAHYVMQNGRVMWRYGLWSRDEVLAHEMGHGLLNFLAKVEGRPIPAHGKRFCDLLEGWGIHPVPNHGAHYRVADLDSPFGRVEKTLGHARPLEVPRDEEKPTKTDWWRPEKTKGKSSLSLWVCECNPPQRARIGKEEFFATCNICQMPFRRRAN